MKLIVTVDGPSGTGKSSVSRAVAEATGLPHLDTGAFYRAATLAVLERGVDTEDEEAVLDVVRGIELEQANGATMLDGRDITRDIRTTPVTAAVSAVSAHPRVRSLLVQRQREWVEMHGGKAVAEGRDIGSVVFPQAALKVYLDARPEILAMRRALQTGEDAQAVASDMERRDRKDSTRVASPLTVPPGAMVVDTSDMTFDEVVTAVLSLIESLRGGTDDRHS